MKFKVTRGAHNRGGFVYRKGDTIQSSRDLTKVFANKFVPAADSEQDTHIPADILMEPSSKLHSVRFVQQANTYVVVAPDGSQQSDQYTFERACKVCRMLNNKASNPPYQADRQSRGGETAPEAVKAKVEAVLSAPEPVEDDEDEPETEKSDESEEEEPVEIVPPRKSKKVKKLKRKKTHPVEDDDEE